MTHDDNAVNIEPSPGYHHGNLRAAAIERGLQTLASQKEPDIGLRQLARDLGVSAAALYRHYPGKDSLIEALAEEGIAQLGRAQCKAIEGIEDPRRRFVESGIAYVEWAISNPALFRLTFSCPRSRQAFAPTEKVELSKAEGLLRSHIASIMPADLPPEERARAAKHAWSLVHGLAMLVLAGQIANDPNELRAIVEMTDFRLPPAPSQPA